MGLAEKLHLRKSSVANAPAMQEPVAPLPHVVAWDLDETVGEFSGFMAKKFGLPEAKPLRLRYGMTDLLDEFSENNGFRHYITSDARSDYIGQVLNTVHMQKKFAGNFGRDDVSHPKGKFYQPVARDNTFTLEQMRSHMIAIGDSNKDKPVDIGGMVFVELPLQLDAFVAREILTTLLEKGEGDFQKGYQKLYDQAEKKEGTQRRKVDIGNDIAFSMEYRIADTVSLPQQRAVPVIYDIRTDTHKKEPVVFF